MKLIRKTRLFFKEGKADKVYEVDLHRVARDRYVVDFRHGKRGADLREGTRTSEPTDLKSAEAIFNSVVVSKMNQGYKDEDAAPETGERAPAEAHGEAPDDPAGESDPRDDIETAMWNRFQTAVINGDARQIRRAVWRTGEIGIRKAAPALMDLIPSRDDLMDYTVAWALGRCGDDRAHAPLQQLRAQTSAAHVKQIATEAMLALASEEKRRILHKEIASRLPQSVRRALDDGDADRLAAAVGFIVARGGPSCIALLEGLYQIALFNDLVRPLLLSVLAEIPFKAGFFKGVRRIFKAAEFRLDADVFGLLARRFEVERAAFHRSSWSGDRVRIPGTWKFVPFVKEMSGPDSRLAYSNRTRNYFRRRAWRTLRRMGRIGDARYVPMAVGILLSMSDADAKGGGPGKSRRTRYRRTPEGRWEHHVYEQQYADFGGYVAFNHILHENSPRLQPAPSGLSWIVVDAGGRGPAGGDGRPRREEAWPELWDRRPDALLTLLSRSRCAPVHRFAARALADNDEFCKKLSASRIIEFLTGPYEETMELGRLLAERRYDPEQPDFEMIRALLSSELEAARRTARQWVEASPNMLREAGALVAGIVLSRFPDVRAWGVGLILSVSFSEERTRVMIVRIVAHLMGMDGSAEGHEEMVREVGALFIEHWAEACSGIDLPVIEDLLRHPLAALRALGARLLLNHKTPAEALPPDRIRTLIESETAELRGLGVRLFSRLPLDLLFPRADLIFTFCTSGDREVRQAAFPLVRRLAGERIDFGRDLFLRLLPRIFRKEPVEGFHRDLAALMADALEPAARELDHNTVWRLLNARSRGALQLGARLLAWADPDAFTVRQWARLGGHPVRSVRQWAWEVYGTRRGEIRKNMADGLRILDSGWEDAREFALAFFREHFEASDWSPTLLVGICDSARDDVQRFGRELITTFFEEADGVEYMVKLSQHPSTNVQLFVSNFIEEYAGADVERLTELTPYFVTVLSRVNRGRVAKTRVMKHLHRAALESKAAAAVAAPIFDRVSATIAVGDRGDCVRILRDIALAHPGIPTRLKLKPVQRRPTKAPEGPYAI